MANLMDQKAASRDLAANAARQAMFGHRTGAPNVLRRVGTHTAAGMAFSFVVAPVLAAELQTATLADLSLEQLANIEVTSVSRRAERLGGAPASLSGITGEGNRAAGGT